MKESHESFDEAAGHIVERAQTGDEVEDRQALVLLKGLEAILRARYPRLTAEERQDVAAESLKRFWEASLSRLVDPGRKPGAYVTAIAKNAALERIRARMQLGDEDEVSGGSSEDVSLEAVIDREDAFARLDELRQRAIDDDDRVAVQVITSWLDLYEEMGMEPTSRQVAEDVGISHTSVNRALARIRTRGDRQ